MLEVKNLRQTYFYGTNALNGISFVLNEGEKLAVLSKKGGGKTSLLKCIAGLFPAESGNVILDDKDVTNLKIKDRGVRLVYDDGGLISKRTVLYNLTYPLKIRKINKDERVSIAYQIAKDYGLEPFIKEMTFRLFTPEIIALALARLELRDSSLTLIDDIFSLACGQERKEIFEKFLPKLHSIGGNVIFATDSVEEAFSFADKVLILNNGYQDQIGTFDELKNHPQSLLVDELINPNKNRMVLGVVNGVVELDDVKIKLPDEYDCDEVFVSYELINNDSGSSFNAVYKKYLSENSFVYYNGAGEKCVSSTGKTNFKVKVNTNTLKFFNRVNEKVLTFEIL